MTTAIAPNGNLPAVAPPAKLVVQDTSATAYMFDTARFEQCYRIAKAMAQASLIPDHLTMDRAKKELPFDMIAGNCFMIVNQAIRWGMDPFALPAETYVVANKLGFQGKLIAAVINARAGLKKPLQVIYNSGRGDDLAAVVFGSREDIPKEAWPLLKKLAKEEDGEVYTDLMSMDVMCIRISVGQAKTTNDMWKKDPQQKLFYTGATKWARRHAPEIILGVLTDDDLDRMRHTETLPEQPTLVEDITARLSASAPRIAEGQQDATTETVDAATTEPTTTEPEKPRGLEGVKEMMMAVTDSQKTINDIARGIRKDRILTADEEFALDEMAEAHKERIRGKSEG
jgi:hypothetical protein